MHKETYIVMDYDELEKLVKENYNVSEYDFVSSEEGRNDSVVRYYDVKKEELEDYDKLIMFDFIETYGRVDFITSTLLTDLCNKGVLEEGNYLIGICW